MNKSALYHEMKKNLGYFEQAVLKSLGESYATSMTVKNDRFYRYAKVDLGDGDGSPSVIVFVSPSKVNLRYGLATSRKSAMAEAVLYTYDEHDDHEEVLRSFKRATKAVLRSITDEPDRPTVGYYEWLARSLMGTFPRSAAHIGA